MKLDVVLMAGDDVIFILLTLSGIRAAGSSISTSQITLLTLTSTSSIHSTSSMSLDFIVSHAGHVFVIYDYIIVALCTHQGPLIYR